MASQKPAKPSDDAVKRAQGLWENFTTLSTYSVIFTIAVLVLMAIFLIDW